MPQQSLLPDQYPPMTSLTLEVRSWPHTPEPDQIFVGVRVGVGGKNPKTRASITMTGVERDYLNTLFEDVTTAYMWGETTRDVVRAVGRVTKLAKAHARSHSF